MAEKYCGIEKYIFADVYNLFLKYKDIPNEDYYWECLIKDADAIYAKYKSHPLVRSMVVATMTQLEHKISGRLKDGLNHAQWEEKLSHAHKIGW